MTDVSPELRTPFAVAKLDQQKAQIRESLTDSESLADLAGRVAELIDAAVDTCDELPPRLDAARYVILRDTFVTVGDVLRSLGASL